MGSTAPTNGTRPAALTRVAPLSCARRRALKRTEPPCRAHRAPPRCRYVVFLHRVAVQSPLCSARARLRWPPDQEHPRAGQVDQLERPPSIPRWRTMSVARNPTVSRTVSGIHCRAAPGSGFCREVMRTRAASNTAPRARSMSSTTPRRFARGAWPRFRLRSAVRPCCARSTGHDPDTERVQNLIRGGHPRAKTPRPTHR